jgi:hypothetical protein
MESTSAMMGLRNFSLPIESLIFPPQRPTVWLSGGAEAAGLLPRLKSKSHDADAAARSSHLLGGFLNLSPNP